MNYAIAYRLIAGIKKAAIAAFFMNKLRVTYFN